MNFFDKLLSRFNRSNEPTINQHITKEEIVVKETEPIVEEKIKADDNIFEYPKYYYSEEKQCFFYSQLEKNDDIKEAKRSVFSFVFSDSESPFILEIRLETLFLILKESKGEAYIIFFGENICNMIIPILKDRKVCTGFVKVQNKKTYFKKYEDDDYELFDEIIDTDPFFDIDDYSKSKPKKKK